jgi:pimeloyl-ACP methyl ester carboxylesterase
MKAIKSLLLASSLAVAFAPAIAADPDTRTTVVLVHGAFADGSSWNKVIPLLQAKGLKVVAVQNPLTSLADDVAFTNRAINAQAGPVVLVGHSWGGAVITQAGGNDRVKALVYVAAFAPSVGENALDGAKAFPAAPGLASPIATPDGYLTLSPETVAKHFAQDVPAAEANLIATTQGAVRAANFEEKVTVAAWTNKPSWYIVANNDHMINPDAERALAKKINATTTSLPSSHVAMVSHPAQVAKVIVEAASKAKP